METEFNSLVENALDFLEKSVRDLEAEEPKYSVIHFYSGLELLLKARLQHEHWSLCASDVNKTVKARFAVGDFESIGLQDARDRLANVLNCKLFDSENRSYEKLRKRRNQAVHFFHPDDLASTKKVAVEQLVGWHFLYARLTKLWNECFDPYRARLDALNQTIARRKEYPPSVYSEIKDDIAKKTKHRLLAKCEVCEQQSALTVGAILGSLHRLECEVCNSETTSLFLPCEQCSKLAPRLYGQTSLCQWCGYANVSTVDESFAWAKTNHQLPAPRAWCGDCGYTVRESVVEIVDASFCLACHSFNARADLRRCGWCGDFVTGHIGHKTSPGCIRCAYHIEAEAEGGEVVEQPEFLHNAAARKLLREMEAAGF